MPAIARACVSRMVALRDCACRYAELAMGGGQQATALSMLREAALGGGWLLLKNLHLVVTWLPTLEKELNSLKPHRDFRLWLTTESHDAFTPILLQQVRVAGAFVLLCLPWCNIESTYVWQCVLPLMRVRL